MLWTPVRWLVRLVLLYPSGVEGSKQEKGPGQKGEESVGYLSCSCASVKAVRDACCSQK